MISVHFQGNPFNITVTQVYALTSNAEKAEVERFCDDLQDLLELTPKKDVLFIIGNWDYCDIEWFALEMYRYHSVIFEIASKYCISDSFVDYEEYSFSSKGFLPTVLDIMII